MDGLAGGHAATMEKFWHFAEAMTTSMYTRRDKLSKAFPKSDDAKFFHKRGSEQQGFPWLVFIELSIIFVAIVWTYKSFIANPLIRFIMRQVASHPAKITHMKVIKFAQANMEFLLYSIFGIIGMILVLPQPWLYSDLAISAKQNPGRFDFTYYWWTNQPNNAAIGNDLAFFYVAYASRYVERFVSTALEPKRSDYFEMQTHHVVTFSLVILSYYAGYVKPGLVIMVLMDLADPFLHLAKQLIYLRDVAAPRNSILSVAADVCFVVFTVVFTLTRVAMYPFIVWSAFNDNFYLVADPKFTRDRIDWVRFWNESMITDKLMLFFLMILFVLQALWWILIVRILVRVAMGKGTDDDRSDDENEPEAETGSSPAKETKKSK